MIDVEERVVLVDEHDGPVGTAEKLSAHRDGLLHRAVSVLLFDGAGRTLLQRRFAGKYHSGGLWSNTCCGHPRPEEESVDAARRRLREEMGIDCALTPVFHLRYRVELSPGLHENEYDHVFLGRFTGDPAPDPAEVEAWRWAELAEVRGDAAAHPERYTHWFHLLLERVEAPAGGDPPAEA